MHGDHSAPHIRDHSIYRCRRAAVTQRLSADRSTSIANPGAAFIILKHRREVIRIFGQLVKVFVARKVTLSLQTDHQPLQHGFTPCPAGRTEAASPTNAANKYAPTSVLLSLR